MAEEKTSFVPLCQAEIRRLGWEVRGSGTEEVGAPPREEEVGVGPWWRASVVARFGARTLRQVPQNRHSSRQCLGVAPEVSVVALWQG